MKTTFTRLQRFHHRAAARRHYVDPILFQEGFYRHRLAAAELATTATIRLRLPTDAASSGPAPAR